MFESDAMAFPEGPDPLVTVVVPVGPGSDVYLGGLIRSLRGDFPSTAATLLFLFDGCNPCSTDAETIRDLGGAVISLPKQRDLAHVLNIGLRAATTEWISRIDADDEWPSGRLASQLSMVSPPTGFHVAFGSAQVIDATGRATGTIKTRSGPVGVWSLLWRNTVVHPAAIFARLPALAVGGYPELPRLEDYGLWLRLRRSGDIVAVGDCWVKYRAHSGQATSSAPSQEAMSLILDEKLALVDALKLGRAYRAFVVCSHWAWKCAQKLNQMPGFKPWKRIR